MHVQNKNHQNPLYLISLYKRLDIARVLLNRGATTKSEHEICRSPLYVAASGIYAFDQDLIHVAEANDSSTLPID